MAVSGSDGVEVVNVGLPSDHSGFGLACVHPVRSIPHWPLLPPVCGEVDANRALQERHCSAGQWFMGPLRKRHVVLQRGDADPEQLRI